MKLREEKHWIPYYYYFGGMVEGESFPFLTSSSLTQALWHLKKKKKIIKRMVRPNSLQMSQAAPMAMLVYMLQSWSSNM